VVRCHDAGVAVDEHASGGWRLAVGSHPFRSGNFTVNVPLGAGRAFTVTAKADGSTHLYRYYVRCLPNDFPAYTFTHDGPVVPEYFSVDNGSPIIRSYAVVFDSHGVPVWWYQAPAHATRVLPGGNVLWFNNATRQWEIHRLDGQLVRILSPVGQTANDHDVQLMGNGDLLFGAYVPQSHVDTSAFGGSGDATVTNAELQQVSPSGQLLWDWHSQDQISLAETGHRWPWVVHHPNNGSYDILHWNSIEPDGDSVIASFRHLDAILKIRKTTGKIVWKLGGTHTPQSLTVKKDPRGVPLGAQHDARLLPDGTLTVFDNRTNLDSNQPRAVRFKINEKAHTATLLEAITDPEIPGSNCCGSARRLSNRDWLIDWGQGKPIGGYEPNGHRTFLLTLKAGASYRAEPVPPSAVSAKSLRAGMTAMAGGG
jgi:Arylsulfotransferase (ASST)